MRDLRTCHPSLSSAMPRKPRKNEDLGPDQAFFPWEMRDSKTTSKMLVLKNPYKTQTKMPRNIF